MTDPGATFSDFLQALRGREPFPWQDSLAERLAEGDPPSILDVPTGLGKTSVLHCWAYALASQARMAERTLPLRLCFVVDRRLIVDSAYDEARDLAERLEHAEDGAVGEVAAGLRQLHGELSLPPLRVVRMRGGATWDSRWLPRPDQAAIVVGTVDQFGSRLLFRGYGVSPAMRPIDAALVGLDSWLVVDEAHIAEPLVQTARRVAAYQERMEAPAGLRPLRVMEMSATVRVDGAADVMKAAIDEETSSTRFPAAAAEARRRTGVAKPVQHVDLTGLRKRQDWSEQSAELGRYLAHLGRTLPVDAPAVIGVIANTVSAARAAHAELRALGEDSALLIGRIREHEREQLLGEWLPRIEVGAARDRAQRLFVVATQTIEVGANIDFDAIVTECAPLPALIQRFGRVNRIGGLPERPSLIVHAGFAHADDPVYGEATAETWGYLCGRAGEPEAIRRLPERRLDSLPSPLDFGLRPVQALAAAAPDAVVSEHPFTPVALGAHFERWAASNPAPYPDQAVAPFLHGVKRGLPEVFVAWRAAPPVPDVSAEAWERWLAPIPPVAWEFVSVPLNAVRRFLAAEEPQQPVADLESALTTEDETETGSRTGTPQTPDEVLGVIYRGRGDQPTLVRRPVDVRAGEQLVLDSRLGGHDDFGWTGCRNDGLVPDVADLAPTRRRALYRLALPVLETWGWCADAAVQASLARVDRDHPTGDDALSDVLEVLAMDESLPCTVRERLSRALDERWSAYAVGDDEPAILLLQAPVASSTETAVDAISDDDAGSTSLTAQPVSLRSHGEDVGAVARRFAEHLGLPSSLIAAVAEGGRWHDLGKLDPRFQTMLHDGDRLSALAAPEPLAKSGRDGRDPVTLQAHQISRLPRRFRHEAVSALLFDALVARFPDRLSPDEQQLARHLIVSHHGQARPLLSPMRDPAPAHITAELEGATLQLQVPGQQVDWDQPGRFEQLGSRYGWWGLAFLETLVRLADMLCSEEGR